jgi:hypothetical protein
LWLPTTAWWIAAIFLGSVAAFLPFWNGPFFLDPMPLLLFLLLLLFQRWHTYASLALGPVLFFLSSPTLIRGQKRMSKTSVWVMLGLTLLDLADLLASVNYGYVYQGQRDTNFVLIASLVWLGALWMLLRLAFKRNSYWMKFAFHFAFVFWLLTYAFPQLGELP